ncbi:MAG: MFS transporter [Actinomycetota bacterium]|nr:MFS transporter [Actinomycetota bacterium]
MTSPEMSEPSGHRVRAMLAVPDFRRLLRVRLTGQCGDGLFQGALFGATFFNPEKATSAGEAAVAFATLLLPYSLVGPFAGVLLDRWSRQRVLLVANATRAVVLVVLALSLAHTGPTSAPTIGLALVVVSLNRFVLSGLSASLPHVVDLRALVTANSFTTTLGTGAAAVGGFTSVGLRHLWGKGDGGAAWIATTAACVYLGASWLASRLSRRALGPDTPAAPLGAALATVARGLVAGARHVNSRRPARRALLAVATYRFFSGLLFVSTLLLYTPHGYLHRGFAGLGQTLTAAVAGGLLAALVTPRVTRRTGTQPWIVTAFALAAVVTITLVPPYEHGVLLLAGAGLGFAGQASKICVDTLLQESVEDDFRGRVFSFYDTLFNVSFVSAAVAASVIVPDNGRSLGVVTLVTCGFGLTALVYGGLLRRAQEPAEPILTPSGPGGGGSASGRPPASPRA